MKCCVTVECSNFVNGVCVKCDMLRHAAALLLGIAENHAIHELTFLGVSLRTINSIESHLGLLWLEDLLKLSNQDLRAVPNIGEIQITQLKSALKNYGNLERHRIDQRHCLQRTKQVFDEKYRYGGVEFREEGV